MKRALAILIVSSLGSLNAWGMQDAPSPPEHQDTQQSDQEAAEKAKANRAPKRAVRVSVDAIRARLETAIKRGEQQLARNREALERLDKGESPAAVLRAVRTRSPSERQPRQAAAQETSSPQTARPPQPAPDLNEIRAFISEHIPEMSEQIETLAALDPNSADRLTMRLAPKIRGIRNELNADEELGQLKVGELRAGLVFVGAMRKYRAAVNSAQSTEDERSSALAELRLAAEQRFEMQMKLREHEVSKLAEQLLALRMAMTELRESRDDEIDQMITATHTSPAHHRHPRRERPGRDD